MIAWVDIETTGLNPKEDSILEVALVITDSELEIVESNSWVLSYHGGNLSPSTFAMHSKNNLLKECAAKSASLPSEVAYLMQRLLKAHPAAMPMAGNSVHFDRGFLKHHMPEVEAIFHYRNIDVSTIRQLACMWKPEVEYKPEELPHRALPDILNSIAELAHYRKHWLC